jgi:hypothetical protein
VVCNDSGNGPGTTGNAPLINTDRRKQKSKFTAEARRTQLEEEHVGEIAAAARLPNRKNLNSLQTLRREDSHAGCRKPLAFSFWF